VLAAGFRKVVVAMQDPAPHVNGRGIEHLRNTRVEVEVGLLEAEAQRLVAPFVTLTTRSHPYVHAKWAMTLDGRIASHTRQPQWISNEASRAEVHRLRGRMDGILVGVETVLADDPLLTARPPGPRTATRIVLDGRGRTPLRSRLCQSVSEAPLLIATTAASPGDWRAALARLGVDVFVTHAGDNGQGVDLPSLLAELGRRRMTNLLVEGGARVLGAFFDARLVDECHVFIAPKIVGGDGALAAVGGQGLAEIPAGLADVQVRTFDGDVYVQGWMRGRAR
jgi:diaminohydroxyphosphoribosylaminopyrimidine deaminase/5-amino-6-(5-phosphoribosylamino)uracil reductase